MTLENKDACDKIQKLTLFGLQGLKVNLDD